MKLLTKEIRDKLPPLYSQEKVEDPMVIVKFFSPVGSWTWFATEASVYRLDEDGNELTLPMSDWQEGDDVLFFGLVKGFESELGYFTLKELESVKGPLGLGIERDGHFKPRLLSEVKVAA